MKPLFLSLAEIIEIHNDQITRYGGNAGIRDLGLLKSAMAIPYASFDGHYLHSDLSEMAGAYLYHIIKNHPFVDGNKRTGAVAALVFLEINSIELNCSEGEFENVVWQVAKGNMNKPDAIKFIKQHCSLI